MTPLQPVHATVAAEIHRRSFAGAPSDAPWDAAAIAALLAMPGAFGWLAGECEPSGFVLTRRAADEAEIITIAVLPEWRGQGIGGRLLDAAMLTAAEAGAGRLFLEVADDNTAARALYEGRGFSPVGRRPHYYGQGRHALVLARSLTADPGEG